MAELYDTDDGPVSPPAVEEDVDMVAGAEGLGAPGGPADRT